MRSIYMPVFGGAARRLLAGSSLAMLAAAWGSSAQAQSADAPTAEAATAPSGDQGQATAAQTDGAGEAIVVTGVRASLRSAQQIKRNAPQIVDSIVAEDIGKLPDRNVAEALQRISGIQIQRAYGEGTGVAIRGLTQVRTELNGRDIFTAQGTNGLNLEDVPSELLAGVDVYKNPSSDLIEDQLSGLINFRTRKPFDFDGYKVSVSATNSYYDLVQKHRPFFSGLVSGRWDTPIGEIGVLANVSYQKTAFREDTISTEPFYTLDPTNATDAATLATLGRTGQTTTLPHGTGIGQHYGQRQRFGTDVAVQWRPSSTLELTGEVFRNDYKFRFNDYSWFAYTGTGTITPVAGAPFTYASNGDFESGTFQNVNVGSNTSLSTRHSRTTDYSLNAKWKPTANLTVSADGQYVKSTTNTLRSIVLFNSTAGTLYQNISSSIPVINVGPAGSVTNPANYSNGGYLDDMTRVNASDKVGRLDAEYRFDGGILQSIKAGVRFADRKNVTNDTGYRYVGVGAPLDYEQADLSDFFRGQANLFGNVVAFPLNTVLSYDATRAALGITTTPQYVPSGVNRERQKTYTGYAAAFFKADQLPVPVDGNVGVRLVRTELAASGFYQQIPQVTQPDGTQITGSPSFNAIAVRTRYTDALPSLNLRFHLTDQLQLRLAASKNIARPTFDQLNPSLTITEPSVSQQNQIHTTSGGNPYLKPMRSNNFDASLEWYFSRTGSITAAGFYKDIKDYIQTSVATRNVTFPTSGRTYSYDVTSYNNVAKAKVKGAEIAYQQFFDFLPGLLKGLGMQANFTYVDSRAPSPATTGPVTNVPLENLSKYSYNLIGIYEIGKLSARVAYNWRSKYVQTTSGNGTGNLPVFNKAFGQLDASVSYAVTPHFTLQVDGRNLTNTILSTYFGIDTRPRDVTMDDRRVSITARITY